MLRNTYNVTNIHMTGSVRHFCPLGNDWCCTTVSIEVKNPAMIPDYCDVTAFLKTLDGQHLIIEEIAKKTHDFVVEQTDGEVSVSVETKDAEHLPAGVTVK